MPHSPNGASLDRLALSATLHCATGCSIGEVLGMLLGTAFHWPNLPTIVLAVVLAFVFGYGLTMRPLLRQGMGFAQATRLAFAADTVSIAVMELVDNALMLVIPGAMDAHVTEGRFWLSLLASLVIAAAAIYPVNRWMIRRGQGHARVHAHYGGEH